MTRQDYGLGRVHIPDERDRGFLLAAAPPTTPEVTSRFWWTGGWWGNQGDFPHCVEYSWHHWLCDGPVTQKRGPLWTPGTKYPAMQRIDEWEGEAYDGTSVRAGAKIIRSLGYIESFLWTWDVHTLARTVLMEGPVVGGTNWYSAMFYPQASGLIKVDGRVEGGHAYKIDGCNWNKELFRIKNSWGRGWGRNGFALISFADMDRLLREDGEACLAIEKKVK